MDTLKRIWKLFPGALFAIAALALAACSGSGPTSPSAEGTVYAALGASDAVGVGADPFSEGYVFKIADRIASSAAGSGAVLVRLSAVPLDDSLFSSDGFHPGNAGHQRLAEAFRQEIGPRL